MSPPHYPGLGQAENAVLAAWEDYAVPVYRGLGREPIGDVDANPVSFHQLDHGARRRAVEPPRVDRQSLSHLMDNRLGHQVEDLVSIHDLERERRSVGNKDGSIIPSGNARCIFCGFRGLPGEIGNLPGGFFSFRKRCKKAQPDDHETRPHPQGTACQCVCASGLSILH